MPSNLGFDGSASIPLVGLTTYQALVDVAKLSKGESVLIHAGSGGIGTFAIQLAKHLGAKVTTTTSAKNVSFVKGLGADKVIDYTSQNYLDEGAAFDVVYVNGINQGISESASFLRNCLRVRRSRSGSLNPSVQQR